MHGASKHEKLAINRKIGVFLRLYQRRAQRGQEPNDRQYDHKLERYLRKLKPEELDLLLNGDEDEHLHR